MCTLRVEILYCGTCEADACGVTDGTQRRTTRADACVMGATSRRHTHARSEKREAWTRVIDASSREEKSFLVARARDERAEGVAREWTTRRRGAGPRATRIRIARARGRRAGGR